MKLPRLNEIKISRNMVDVFRGYNHNLRIGEGEFYDMQNLSSDNYPILSPRPKRCVYKRNIEPQGMIVKDAFCYIDGADFVINEYRVPMELTIDDKPKQLISMGSYVIILPDKKWINTTTPQNAPTDYEYGNIECKKETSSLTTFTMCKIDGVAYESAIPGAEAPPNPENLTLWIDESSTPHTLKQYSKANDMWVSIPTTYIKISASKGAFDGLNEGDGVTISGITAPSLSDLNSSMVIQAKGDDYIVVIGFIDTLQTQETPIKIERVMPEMDFVIESGNRLWGCHYGIAKNGEMVNEIYASKLGDFKNWNCFNGISTDSYVASVGTDGVFTGAIEHLGYPLFFKENCLHKVYGNYPSNYQVQTTTCRGVDRGSHRTLAIVNEVLYYKSRSSICAYDGSLPEEISSVFGETDIGLTLNNEASAGVLDNKYYISLPNKNGAYNLFIFDVAKGMWHKEECPKVTSFCSFEDNLFFILNKDIQAVIPLAINVEEEDAVEWMAESGIIGVDSPDKKYISRIDVRLSLELGAKVHFYLQYDSSGVWEHQYTMTGKFLQSFSIPLLCHRCDHLRLRIEGIGNAKIFSICKNIEQGSDV